MGRYVSNAKSILNNGPVFQCVIWNKKTGKSVALNAMIDTGGLFTTIDVDISIELDLDVVGRQGLRSYNDVDDVYDKYDVSVSFGNDSSKKIPVSALGVKLTGADEKLILGRDFLVGCNVYYLGSKNQCFVEF